MAYYDTNPQPAAGAQCPGCGVALNGQPNCPGCGIAVPHDHNAPFPRYGAAQQQGYYAANQYPPQAPPPPAPQGYPPIGHGYNPEGYYQQPGYGGGPPPGPPQKSILPWAIAAVLVALIAGGVALVLLSGDDSKDNDSTAANAAAAAVAPAATAGPAYEQQVVQIFAPVDEANKDLSSELVDLPSRGGGSAQSRAAVQKAMDATSAARGALGATAVPDGSDGLADIMRDVLDREEAYLDTVDKTLSRPSGRAVTDLPRVSSTLTSGIELAGPLDGKSDNVYGSDNLADWAAATKRAAARKRRMMARRPAPSANTPAPPPASRGTDCGAGIHAGPNTSCAFARNVFQAWLEAPGLTATVEVYSPATGQTYTMHCAPAGSGTTCSGGNGASVSF